MKGLNPLEALMAAAAEQAEATVKPLPLPAAQIMELREYAAPYGQCSFKVGDVVTPRPLAPIRGVGQPHLVIEVACEPIRNTDGDVNSQLFGARLDMRVVGYHPTTKAHAIGAHWVESWMFEPFVEKA